MAEKTFAARPRSQTVPTKEETHSRAQNVAPPVDIFENAEGLVVVADLPGVAKEGLDIRVENNVLTIQGSTSHAVTGDPIYREYELANFYRQFELSDKVDQGKISAELKHGVLTLRLPKAEEARPKRIEVKLG